MRLERLLENRTPRSRPLVACGASLAALALTPLALADAPQDSAAPADKKSGSGFSHAVLVSPVAKISSNFGKRTDPVSGKTRLHQGTDIKAPMGTPVHMPSCGTVVFSGPKDGYGETIEVAFEDGSKMRFAQLSKRLVSTGDEVRGGTVIGEVGASGRATGPHLHLEHWRSVTDAETGETVLEPRDPRESAGLVLHAAG